ncbi:hypothetical protein MCHI_001621, partial [Candidatus Magnetoovum chiemensis]
MEECGDFHDWQMVIDIAWAVDKYLNMRGYLTDRQKMLEMGMNASRALGDKWNEGAFIGNRGTVYSRLGEMETALKYYNDALVIVRQIGDKQGEATWLGNIGKVYSDKGELETALKFYNNALV